MNDTSAIITLCNNINDVSAVVIAVIAVIAGSGWTWIFLDGYLTRKIKAFKNNEMLKGILSL